MDNKAFEDVSKNSKLKFRKPESIDHLIQSIKNEENCVVKEKVNNIPIDVISDTQVGKMKNETDASSSYRTGYQGQMEILPTLHELHNPAAESQQQQQEMRVTTAREFVDGSRFKVSTYVPTGIEMENITQGSAQIGNDNSITGLTNRKGSVATVSSHDRNRKMSRDVIPSIEHYRTQPPQQ
ncbi:hypothetical protein DAPPUDRAFT_114618, partial [Daphnia pulex]